MQRIEEELRIAELRNRVGESEDTTRLGRPFVDALVGVPDPAADAADLLSVGEEGGALSQRAIGEVALAQILDDLAT